MATLHVGDIVIAKETLTSAGEFGIPVDVGWEGIVQDVHEHDAFIAFQCPPWERVLTLWIRAVDFGKFLVQPSCDADLASCENLPGDLPSGSETCTAEALNTKLNTKLDEVGGF